MKDYLDRRIKVYISNPPPRRETTKEDDTAMISNKPTFRLNLGEKPSHRSFSSNAGSTLLRIPKAGGLMMMPRSIQKPLTVLNPKISEEKILNGNGVEKIEKDQKISD